MSLGPPQSYDLHPVNPDSSLSHFAFLQFTPTAITAAWPPVVTCVGSNIQNGQALRFTQFYRMPLAVATGMEQLNNNLYYAQQATADTFQLFDVNGFPIDGRNFTTYVSGGQFTLTGPTLPILNPAPPPPPGVPPFPPV